MGNQRSREAFMCQGSDRQKSVRKFKIDKEKRQKLLHSKDRLNQLLMQHSHRQLQDIKDLSPFDQSLQFIHEKLFDSCKDWAEPLLQQYLGEMSKQIDRKYQTYKWNIEVNLQKEVVKTKALRQCVSDSTKADIFNLSASSGNNEKDGGRNQLTTVFNELSDNDANELQIVQQSIIQIQKVVDVSDNNFEHTRNFSPNQDQTYSIDQTYFENQYPRLYSNEKTMHYRSQKNFTVAIKRQFSAEIADDTYKRRRDKIKTFLEKKETNDLFRRKIKIIKKHLRNTQHPLRILIDLFAVELHKVTLFKSTIISSDNHSSEYAKLGCKNVLKVSERLIEDQKSKQVKFDKIIESVQTFIQLLRSAIIRFYQIDYNGLKLGVRNYFTDFYGVDDQYYLDAHLIREKKKLAREQPIRVLLSNLDEKSVQFQLIKYQVNKSQFNPESQNQSVPARQSEKNPMGRPRLLESLKDETEIYRIEDNKTVISTVTNPKSSMPKPNPYQKSIKLLKELEKITSLRKKKSLIKYVWNKLQQEVYEYWKQHPDIVSLDKQKVFEDTRLCLMAYIITKSQCQDILVSFKALSPFIDQHQMKDSMPMATVESAIKVIIQDLYYDQEEIKEDDGQYTQLDVFGSEKNRFMNINVSSPANASLLSRRSVVAQQPQRREFLDKIQHIKEENSKQDQQPQDLEDEEEELHQKLRADAKEKRDQHINSLRMMYQDGTFLSRKTFQKTSQIIQHSFKSFFRYPTKMKRHNSRENFTNIQNQSKIVAMPQTDKNYQFTTVYPEYTVSRVEQGSSYSKDYPHYNLNKFSRVKTPENTRKSRKFTDQY
ncbi:UNKNOWN [Stylonychia lemnae]|uniref:Uncharacterized protein n=1 Tax=Stylonychia lemnae TaxID=5949 RepID=A0A078ARL9_STYLE|nr:UNKNOWN [Stylonychia lemnae]|eukprot:CDW84849.1 UNKNOWN [Stylonychia lemnae]